MMKSNRTVRGQALAVKCMAMAVGVLITAGMTTAIPSDPLRTAPAQFHAQA